MYIKGFEHISDEKVIRFYICKWADEILVNVKAVDNGCYAHDSLDEYKDNLFNEEEMEKIDNFIAGCGEFLTIKGDEINE